MCFRFSSVIVFVFFWMFFDFVFVMFSDVFYLFSFGDFVFAGLQQDEPRESQTRILVCLGSSETTTIKRTDFWRGNKTWNVGFPAGPAPSGTAPTHPDTHAHAHKNSLPQPTLLEHEPDAKGFREV